MSTDPRAGELADGWQRARPRLIRLAYTIIGIHSEAEDVVADCWLSLHDADQKDPIRDIDRWATVAVARASLDVLRSSRMRRERYVGPWLPEPLVDSLPGEGDPADRVTLDDSVSYALLVALEALTPAERTAWVLHDLFAVPFEDVARIVGRSTAAVRQLAARARRHLAAGAPRIHVDPTEHDSAVVCFLAAARGGDLAALIAILDPEVVLTSDGGGQVTAARRPIHGRIKVSRLLAGLAEQLQPDDEVRPVLVNAAAGIGVFRGGVLTSVVALTAAGGLLIRIDVVRAPSKLPRLERSAALPPPT